MQGDLGTISRVQGGWRAATHLSLPQERPIGAPQVLARQAKHPGVGDAKSGRIASMQNMLAARPTVGRIGTC